MKAKKFLPVILAIAVMVTSLLCFGVSAAAENSGNYSHPVFNEAQNTGAVVVTDIYDGYTSVGAVISKSSFELFEKNLKKYSDIELQYSACFGDYYINFGMFDDWPAFYYRTIDSKNDCDIDTSKYLVSAVSNRAGDLVFIFSYPNSMEIANQIKSAYNYILRFNIVGGGNILDGDYSTHLKFTDKFLETNDPKDISTLKFGKISDKPYTGKALKPAVTVKDGDKKLVSGTDYTVSYKNNTKIGTATVTITGKGDYTGTKKLTFKIVPKKTTLSIKENSTSKVTLSWKKSTGAAGYQIYCSTNGGSYKKLATVKSAATLNKVISNLNTDKNAYKFKIRPYAKSGSKTVYGSWSNIVSAG